MFKFFNNLKNNTSNRCVDCPYKVSIVNYGDFIFPRYGLKVDPTTMIGCCKIQKQLKDFDFDKTRPNVKVTLIKKENKK